MMMRWQPWAIGAGVVAGGLVILNRAYAAPSCLFIPASVHGGKRSVSNLRWIVLHSTESDKTARDIGNYFAQTPREVTLPSGKVVTQPGGSTQIVVGEDGCVRCVPDDEVPAGVPPLNEQGLHIEFVGYAAWTRDQWMARKKTLETGRQIVRSWSSMYGIPKKLLGPAALKDAYNRGGKGVTTHMAATQAFRESDHMDPGSGFPLDYILGGIFG
jgi:hypothetical protein